MHICVPFVGPRTARVTEALANGVGLRMVLRLLAPRDMEAELGVQE